VETQRIVMKGSLMCFVPEPLSEHDFDDFLAWTIGSSSN